MHDVPDASVLITFTPGTHNVQHTLFIPPADPLETMWSVAPPTLEDSIKRFDAGDYKATTDIGKILSELPADVVVHTLPLTHEFPPLPSPVDELLQKSKHTSEYLRPALHIARLIKTEEEIDLIRKANAITSGAHEVLMRELGRFAARRAKGTPSSKSRTGHEGLVEWEVESEQDAEALFVATCRRMGAEQAYLPICASGHHASTLHYV